MCRNMLLSTEKKLEPGLEEWKVSVAVPKKSPCSRSMLSRAWRVSRCHLSLHLASPQQFARCQWQTSSGPSRTYLVYRWCLPIVLLSIAVTSFAMQRIHHPPGYQGPMVELNYFKWFIYLTNWGFMLCVLQAVLALAVVQRSWLRRSHSISCECGDGEQPEHSPLPELPYQGRTPLLCRVYWVTQTVATDLAFVVSLVYWTQVHDSNIHEVNALNVLVHICNSLVMLMEILMTSHPVRPLHVVYTITVGTIYGAFSAVYYLAGGTDRMNEATIYPSLDWRVPAKALTFIALCACVMCVAHAVATLAFFIRTRISARCRAVQEPPPLVAGKLIALTSVE